jgi:hypothetical protein
MAVTAPAQDVPEEQIGFAPDSEVEVRQDGDDQWITLRPLLYRGRSEQFEVPEKFGTDFASVPRPFVWFIPRYGRYTKAAILHDYLCRVKVEAGALRRADADGIFRQAMRTLEVPFLRRWIMWAAVRLGALTTPKGRAAWLRQSWQVLPVGLVAALIVLPAAVVIVATLPVIYLVELVVWLGLLASRRRRLRAGHEVKQVNKPDPNFTL